MKRSFFLLLALVLAASAQEFEVLERGVDHRVIRSVREEVNEFGEQVSITNRYVEVCSSMHYLEGDTWHDTVAAFKITREGAVADTMPHKVKIASNLNREGAVVLEAPDGKIFRSTPMLVAFRDTTTGEMAWVGKLQNCTGELVASNQVVYFNAMEGLKCAIRFTVTKNGFEQELLLQEPISCEDFGLTENPGIRLELWSGFQESPDLVETHVGKVSGMDDMYLDFGSIQIGNGKAFTIASAAYEGPVAKTFGPIEGDQRMFMVEAIAMADLKPMMDSLKQARAGRPQEKVKRLAQKISKKAKDLVAGVRFNRARGLETASIKISNRDIGPALVLDYSTINGALGLFTFQSDTTYYVSGNTTFSGAGTAVRIEGGSVIKYTNNVKVAITSSISWKGGDQYRPVVFTAVDDHSVGEKLNTATLSGQYATAALDITLGSSDAKLKNFSIRNAQVGIILNGRLSHSLDHGQFINCGYGLRMLSSSSALVRNCLFNNVTTNLSGSTGTNHAEHITSNVGTYFKSDLANLNLTNSLIVAVTNPGTPNNTNQVVVLSSATGIFSGVGSATNYLASNTYRNQGITGVSILSDIQRRTTFPPIDLGAVTISVPTTLSPQAQRDTDTPDLGYHYDPLDFCLKESSVTSTLLLTNGVAVGIYGTYGLSLGASSSKIISEGKPDKMNRIVRYNTVQEKPVLWGSYAAGMSLVSLSSSYSPSPELLLRFTDVSLIGTAASITEKFLDLGTSVNLTFAARDCAFANAYILAANTSGSVTPSIYLTNNLWLRPVLTIKNDSGTSGFPLALELRNNLFVGGTIALTRTNHASAVYNVTDNHFDGVTLTASAAGIGNGNNGYRVSTVMSGGTSNLVLTAADYQTGPLGGYYYNTTASATNTQYLVDKGSMPNTTTWGYYHYTTRVDQTKDSSALDIGFHYVATASSSSTDPKDTDSDGYPDYLEDLNGNGGLSNGESDWNSGFDLPAKIRITQPKSSANVP